MSLRPMVPLLVLALLVSVATMALGAAHRDTGLTATAAILFVFASLAVALRTNLPVWRGHAPPTEGVATMRRNIRLAAIVYAWGAAALFAMYPLAGLKWQHGWQYGLGAALFAAGFMAYVYRLGQTQHAVMPPLALTALHGAAAGGGLVFLVGTGKLATERSDWAANIVFLWGGIAVVALCVMAAVTQMRSRVEMTLDV